MAKYGSKAKEEVRKAVKKTKKGTQKSGKGGNPSNATVRFLPIRSGATPK